MYSCVLYGQNTDKGNELDSRKIDYTDKGETSAIGKHLNECEHFHFIVNLYNISVFFQIWTRLLFSTIIIFTQLFYRTLV